MAKRKKAYDSPNRYFTPVSEQRERTNKIIQDAKEKVKGEINLELAKEISSDITSYRADKISNSLEKVGPHVKLAAEKSIPKENPLYISFRKMDVISNFEKLKAFIEDPETAERIKRIKELNPSVSFPNESELYNTITLELAAGLKPEYDSTGNPSNRLARDFDRFYQNQISTIEQTKNLLEFHEKQAEIVGGVFRKSKKLQKQYENEAEFSIDFWALYRQAQGKDKSRYDSSNLLMTMTAGDADYIYGDAEDKEATVDKIRELYDKHQTELGKMRPEIAQSEIVKKAPRGKPSSVETIMPGEKVKPRRNKNMDWFETLDSDADKDELIGYTPESKKEYGKISELFGSFGEIQEAKEVMKETRKRSDLKYAASIGYSPIKEPSLMAYRAVKMAMDNIPDFNRFNPTHISELIEIFSRLREEEEDG